MKKIMLIAVVAMMAVSASAQEVKVAEPDEFLPLTDEQRKECETWSFAANNDLYLGECPVCGQPITIDRKKLIK
jgi:hypothetical protein